MLKTLGVVQACCVSSRFHQNLNRRLGGSSLLGWVVRRVTDAARLDGVIVLAHAEGDDCPIADLTPPDVPVFVSRERDATQRFLQALAHYPAEAVVRVRGDNVFVDPSLIDRLVTTAAAHAECDYMTFAAHDGRPAVLSSLGVVAEWFRTQALRTAARGPFTSPDPERVTDRIYARPDRFRLRLLPAPAGLDRADVRLSVDREEDWDHALAIFEALGPEHLDWQRIAELLDHQPALRQKMANLNRLQLQT